MLLRMLPDGVKDRWDEIRPAIYESLPVHTGERNSLMNDILISILTEQMTVWVSYQIVDGNYIVDALVTTTFSYNIDKTKNIVIYSLYGYGHMPDNSWVEGFDAISKWGKVHNCENIICYTDNDAVINKVKIFNAFITNMCVFKIGG